MSAPEVFSQVGPFTLERIGEGYIDVRYRVWLTSDPEKKVVCEGTPRELGEYFGSLVVAAAEAVGK